MPQDTDRYDFFVSYARKDNQTGLITGFVNGILAEHQKFSGGRTLHPFFDKAEIGHGHDWEHTLRRGIADSRVFVAFFSPNYLAGEWCCKEWKGWIDTEISKHVFSLGAKPVYFVQVPGFEDHTPISPPAPSASSSSKAATSAASSPSPSSSASKPSSTNSAPTLWTATAGAGALPSSPSASTAAASGSSTTTRAESSLAP
jgi:hypothetical protein